MWLLKAASILICIAVTTILALRSFADPLWSDELLTTTLLQADSLPKLWSGIASGIDGNPPFYLTAVWLVIQAAPKIMSSSVALKLINLGLTVAAIGTLCRFGRRFVLPGACYIACVLFIALNDNVVFVAFELRAYALYFLMAAIAVLAQQRLIERRHFVDAMMLALAYVGLALVHTFGIAYVACVAIAGALSQFRGQRSRLWLALGTIAPAIIVVGLWGPYVLEQLDVAKPYGWIERPGTSELLDTLFGSKAAMLVAILELFCIGAALRFNRTGTELRFRDILYDPRWQPQRYLVLVLVGFTLFTLVGWAISIVLYPLFVPRYFTPQMIVAFALHVAFGDLLLRQAVPRIAVIAVCAIIAPLAVINVQINAAHRQPVCSDDNGSFFEASYLQDNLPVIVESPHVFLPRFTYSNYGAAYRFPLDWDVVMKYPDRAKGNAVDFHIMQNLQSWKPMPSIVSTEDIVRNYPQFLVIEQPGRAWFHNLVATRKVTAEKLATTGSDEAACTLWKVTGVQARLSSVD